jgi:hypothetical protein
MPVSDYFVNDFGSGMSQKTNVFNQIRTLAWFLPEMEVSYPAFMRYFQRSLLEMPRVRSKSPSAPLPPWETQAPWAQPIVWDTQAPWVKQVAIPHADDIRAFRELRVDEGDWGPYYAARQARQNPHPLAVAIASDDIDRLQELITSGQFDVATTIPFWPFENTHAKSLLSYAAKHNAIKCIKYLMMNKSTLTMDNLLSAIRSGNAEIIRLFDEKSDQIELTIRNPTQFGTAMKREDEFPVICLREAVLYHQQDVFHRLFDTKYRHRK